MGMRHIAMAVAVAACCLAQSPSWAASDAASAKIISILRSGGFGSSTDSGTKISRVGDIRFGPVEYDIYYYDHINIGNGHGLQKLVVIENGQKYFGSYVIDAMPVRVVGREVKFAPFEGGGECAGGLDVAQGGPPESAMVCGELVAIEK